jgi:nicotinate-nucleotide pyrophosphorylase (carboxylating)
VIKSLSPEQIEPAVKAALAEDIGGGDVTSARLIPEGLASLAVLTAREAGVVAGLDIAAAVFRQLDPACQFVATVKDGDAIPAGTVLATIEGDTRALLAAERTALNFLCHLSGIAGETAKLVAAVAGTAAKICDTRKTTPGLRVFEKYAVTCGGGINHRMGLHDAILIKDNHIAAAGSVTEALRRVKDAGMTVEIEVDTLDQLREVLAAGGADMVLLDNMPPPILAEAVQLVGGRLITEASGGVTLATVKDIAASGVDRISVGWITHSAPILDIGLDFN